MNREGQVETSADNGFCPECGSEEDGYFCRNCGTLLRGEDRVLCPRCNQVAPQGEFCNQCGQSLGGIALQLRQLAMAGDTFWVTAGTPASPPPPEPDIFVPDESVDLADAELPEWLQELPTEQAPPDVESRIYPALQPIEKQPAGPSRNTYFTIIIALMFLLLLGLVFVALFVLLTGS